MMRVLFSLALMALSANTGGHAKSAHEPILQRYQQMVPGLRSVSVLSHLVSVDVARLAQFVARSDAAGARRRANVLSSDSVRLASQSATQANGLRRLKGAERDGVVRAYFGDLIASLSDDWWESRSLVQAAQVIWVDPLMEDSRDVRGLQVAEGAARSYAWRAVLAVRAGNRLWRRFPSHFEYPVSARRVGRTP